MSNEQFYQDLASSHRLFYANWHRFMQLEGAWLHTLFQPLGVQNVLDCTCGIGTQAIALALQDYRVTANDLCEANLAEAQSNADELDLTVLWQQADVRHLNKAYLDGPFDAVISLGNSLPHLLTEDDMIAALHELYDHVKPGGLMLVGQPRLGCHRRRSGRISTFGTSILIRLRLAGGPCYSTCGITTTRWSLSRSSS